MADPQQPLYGPVEAGELLGVRPQVVVNWIRDGRFAPSAVDDLGRNRFTPGDIEHIRRSLGQEPDQRRPEETS